MTQNNSSKKNEVNLDQIFNLILDAKILFISIIILSTAIATYIAVSKPILFNSIAVIELGHYYDRQGKKNQIENIHELVIDLKAEFNYKRQGELEIFAREPNILQVESKPSIDNDSTPLMNELINLIEGRHKRIVNDYYNEIQESYSSSIVKLNNEVILLEDSRVSLIENELSSIESSLVKLNNEASLIENSFFSEIKNINNDDLRLELNLKYQYDFLNLKNEILKLENEKLKLENQPSIRYDIFKLKNQISTIVDRKKLLQEYEERTVFTSLIDGVISVETKPKQTLIVILGFIAGLTISIFLVYIRYALGNIIRK